MYDQNTRINAAITYFFMGPIFLFARKWTPFAHQFVRSHAQRSTLYITIFAIIFFIFFNIKSYLYINIFGFSLDTLIFSGIFFIFLILMIISGYRAFHGYESDNFFEWKGKSLAILRDTIYSEEEKIRIIAAFLPLIGIILASKYHTKEIYTARKISNTFFFLIIFFAALFKSFITFPIFLLLWMYSILFVSTAVFLMAQSRFLTIKLYDYLPTYHQIEAWIYTGIYGIIDFFKVAFGKEKTTTFQQEYQTLLQKYSEKTPLETPFWTHPAIISLPIINFFSFPSFFQKKYHEYQGNIAEWFFLTILTILCFFFGNIYLWYFLLFPICSLAFEGKNNGNIRAPFTSVARNFFIFAYKTRKKIDALQEHNEEKIITLWDQNSKNMTENEK